MFANSSDATIFSGIGLQAGRLAAILLRGTSFISLEFIASVAGESRLSPMLGYFR